MVSDDKLLVRARAGDEVAFRQLVERYERLVRATVGGMLGDSPEAEEVAQDTFIQFFRKLNDFRGESRLSTYLCRIAINLSHNQLVHRQRRQRWEAGWQGNREWPPLPDRSQDPARGELREALKQALQELDPDARAVVVLRLIDGYSVKETAEILGLPAGTVASRLARAQKKLKERLTDCL